MKFRLCEFFLVKYFKYLCYLYVVLWFLVFKVLGRVFIKLGFNSCGEFRDVKCIRVCINCLL